MNVFWHVYLWNIGKNEYHLFWYTLYDKLLQDIFGINSNWTQSSEGHRLCYLRMFTTRRHAKNILAIYLNNNKAIQLQRWKSSKGIPLGYSIWFPHTHCRRFPHRESINFKWTSPLDTSTYNLYTLCNRFIRHVSQKGCELQMDLLKLSIHLKIAPIPWKTCNKSLTGDVKISNTLDHFLERSCSSKHRL